MNFLRSLLCFLAVIISSHTLPGQEMTTNEKKLESAIRIYNEISSSVDALLSKNDKSYSDIYNIETQLAEAAKLMDEITDPDSESMANTRNYFRNNLQYQHGYIYGIQGDYDKMYSLLSPLKEFFTQAGPSYFPLRYKYGGKNYIIDYEDFSPRRGEYYSAMTEWANSKSDYLKMLEYSRIGISFLNDGFLKIVLNNHLLKAKSRLEQYDQEMADYSLSYITSYLNLNKDDKDYFDSLNYSHARGWRYLEEALSNRVSDAAVGKSYARAADLLVKAGDEDLAGKAYQKALNAGNTDKSFLFEILRSGKYSSLSTKSQAVGLLSGGHTLDCYEMDEVSGLYREMGNIDQAENFRKKAAKCRSDQERRARKSAGEGLHFYLGTYPLRYIAHKDYMDFGGVLGITAGKFMLHGSYMKVQRNMYAWTDMFFREIDDNSDEKYRWSGQQIDLAFRFSSKKFRKRDATVYIGPQIGYSTRKLMPVTSDVTNNATGATEYAVELEPLDTYYQLGVNYGQYFSGKAIGMDYHFSIGAAYGKFSMDHPQYNLKDYTYSHSFLDNREEWHWGLVMRAGITIGLSL